MPLRSPLPVSDLADTDDLAAALPGDAGMLPALLQSGLARITLSQSLHPSRRHQQLLRHLVDQAVAGILSTPCGY